MYKLLQCALFLLLHFSITPFTAFSFILISKSRYYSLRSPMFLFLLPLLSLLHLWSLPLYWLLFLSHQLSSSSTSQCLDCLPMLLWSPKFLLVVTLQHIGKVYNVGLCFCTTEWKGPKLARQSVPPKARSPIVWDRCVKCTGILSAVNISCLGVLIIF